MLVFAQLALRCFFSGDRARNKLGAVVLLYAALSFYQANLGHFVVWGLLIAALRGKLRAEKKVLTTLVWVMIIGLIASAISIVSQRVLERLGVVAGTERSPVLSAMLRNLPDLIKIAYNNVLIDGMHFMGRTMGIVTVCLTLGMLVGCILRRREVSMWMLLLTAMIAFAIPYAPHLLSDWIWLVPRTLMSVFSYLSFCALVMLYLSCTKKECGRIAPPAVSAVLVLVIGAFLLVNAKGIYTIGLEQIRSNLLDKYEAKAILKRVEAYEQAEGREVTRFGYVRDSWIIWAYPEAPNCYMDINTRAGAKDWEIEKYLSYYGNRYFQIVEVPEEIRAACFEGREWDEFNPDEQVVIVDDTLYLGAY